MLFLLVPVQNTYMRHVEFLMLNFVVHKMTTDI
jgi:hypothetical protein